MAGTRCSARVRALQEQGDVGAGPEADSDGQAASGSDSDEGGSQPAQADGRCWGAGEAAYYEVEEIVERRTGATGIEIKVRWGGVDPSTGQAWAQTWIGAGQLSPALRRQLTGGRVRRAGKPTGGKADRKQLRLQEAATLKRRIEAEERRREAAAEARAERRMRRGPGAAAGGGAKRGGQQVPGGGGDRRRARQG